MCAFFQSVLGWVSDGPALRCTMGCVYAAQDYMDKIKGTYMKEGDERERERENERMRE